MTAPRGIVGQEPEPSGPVRGYVTELQKSEAGRTFLANVDTVMKIVRAELVSATMKFGPFASAHEAKAVIEEEFDEFWDEVKANKLPGAYHRMRKEATQLSAMAARFLLDVNDENQGKELPQ